MQKLDPYTIPLESINLIEASAGTGKSWTVTYLYLRLILEKGLTVDQILVVTFTDAATKELRDAVRTRLTEALEVFELSEPERITNDIADEYQKLLDKNLDQAESVSRLRRAKLSIDEAAIFTIHGFCQRALSENAFEASLPFESELLADDSDIMQNLADDFWRRRFAKAPKSLIFKLQQKRITPDSLLKDIRNAVGKPYLKILGPDTDEIKAEKWSALEDYYHNAMQTWQDQNEEIRTLLSNPDYEKDYYAELVKNADELFSQMEKMKLSKCLPCELDCKKMSWLGSRLKIKKTAKVEDVEHPFFEQWQQFLDLWLEIDSCSDDLIYKIRIELLEYLQLELPIEKQRLGVLSFDDLLLQLESALQNQPQLATDLRAKYRVAMIDEFQDTDPIQYNIFNTIFPASNEENNDSTVFFVGDPKQAIYSFRGGDIHTYLKAKNSASQQYTLEKNWRSHPKLIAAFNALYKQSGNPFMDAGIQYQAVSAGDRVTENLITPDARSPLRFWNYVQTEEKPKMDDIRTEIANAVAGDIASLLNASNENKAMIGESPITGGDIAILIRSHSQGDLIKAALNKKGITSVQSSKDSIYETHESVEILCLLTAIVEPQREDEVRRALVTEFLGYKAEELLAFDQDSTAWEDILLKMQNWHYQWKNQGFLPMMRSLMKAQEVHQRLLSYDDGERRLTNVLHLSELIHHQSKQKLLSMEEVLRWLQQQQDNANGSERELRLESDENLVKIVTIHKSKGLEYPIVYLPFVGTTGAAFKDKIYSFYQDDSACLEIGSAEADEHKALKIAEEKAEEARLLYVALTRAKYQCTVVTFTDPIHMNPDRTALGWLLTDGETIPSGNSKAAVEQKANFFTSYKETLEKLMDEGGGNISLCELPTNLNERYQSPKSEQNLSAKMFSAEIKSQAQVTSFSGLTAGAHAETPDHDSNTVSALPTKTDDEFPRGATAGTTLHEIYENLDFTKPISEQAEVIASTLNKWGFEAKHEVSASLLMENSLQAEIFEGFSLQQLSKENRLDEMEFYLPLELLQIDDLKQILFKHLPQEDQHLRNAVNTLNFEQVEGYLKGFIDLIFKHDDKFYIVDYKSNSLTDYAPENLMPTMADSHYYLQALIYSVALHRYLKKRVADYQWDTHIGGAYYLFIRGMVGSKSYKSGINRGGVHFNKPSIELITALDDLFMESLL
jgi:exodeoxyribonuclease V beta subunit